MHDKKFSRCLIFSLIFTFAAAAPWQMRAQDNPATYPTMAPLEQYLMDRDSEIALARSAAPESISSNAKILILGRQGYETAVEGKNDFVCLVERSWTSPFDDSEFWNPKERGPLCINAPAVRSHLPVIMKRTELAIAGRSKTQIAAAISDAIEKKDLPTPEPNAMSYMMSKQGYLNNRDGHWLPHLMLFVAEIDPEAWGAGLKGAPLFGAKEAEDRITLFYIPVSKWSDGTPSPLQSGGH